MKIQVADFENYGSLIAVALVDSEYTAKGAGDSMIARVQPYFPTKPVMLLSIEQNGFRGYSHFESHRILALMQLELLAFSEVDLSIPPADDSELPF